MSNFNVQKDSWLEVVLKTKTKSMAYQLRKRERYDND